MYNQRDLVLIPIPFTDLTSHKVRPAIVISNNQYNQKSQDLLVVGVTSVVKDEPYSIPLTNAEMEEGTLPLPSRVRCDKIYLLQNKNIIRKYGKIKKLVHENINQHIKKLIE